VITLRRLLAPLAALQLLGSSAIAAATFQLTFPDVVNDTNRHWDDPTHGAAARATLQDVLNEFGREFAHTATVQLEITSTTTEPYAAGAYTASYHTQPGTPFRDGNTYIKITTGVDLNGAARDGGIDYNFDLSRLADHNGDGTIDLRDFIANLAGLTRHEILHVVGSVSGVDRVNRAASAPNRHDKFLFDSAGRAFVNADGTVSATANLDDPAAYFAAVNGAHLPMNAPGDYSHLIGTTFPYRQIVSAADRAYLATLGYSLAPPAGNLLNISTRMRVLTGDAVLIAGFIVTGLEPKQLVLRAIGPSLTVSGVAGALPDPRLDVFQGETLFTFNDDWRNKQRVELEATGLQPTSDREAATVRTFPPGAYTAVVRDQGGATGVGAVEVYDLTPASDSRVANISTRGFVETGENVMIGGFIVGNTGASLASRESQLVIRALGPSLAAAGVPNALQDPVLSLHDADGTQLTQNDDWRDTQQAELIASGFAPANGAESALIVARPHGPSTAIVRGKNGTVGNALVEVYRLH
jgi:hypothetical protein